MSAPHRFRYVSSDRRVREDRRFVAGKGRFAADIALAGTRHVDRERPARHVRRVEPGHQRRRRGGELGPVEHVVHAGHRQRDPLVDFDDARGRMRTGHDRDMAHSG